MKDQADLKDLNFRVRVIAWPDGESCHEGKVASAALMVSSLWPVDTLRLGRVEDIFLGTVVKVLVGFVGAAGNFGCCERRAMLQVGFDEHLIGKIQSMLAWSCAVRMTSWKDERLSLASNHQLPVSIGPWSFVCIEN